jgi:hypothetical protein
MSLPLLESRRSSITARCVSWKLRAREFLDSKEPGSFNPQITGSLSTKDNRACLPSLFLSSRDFFAEVEYSPEFD